jgi:hypothetical protein
LAGKKLSEEKSFFAEQKRLVQLQFSYFFLKVVYLAVLTSIPSPELAKYMIFASWVFAAIFEKSANF